MCERTCLLAFASDNCPGWLTLTNINPTMFRYSIAAVQVHSVRYITSERACKIVIVAFVTKIRAKGRISHQHRHLLNLIPKAGQQEQSGLDMQIRRTSARNSRLANLDLRAGPCDRTVWDSFSLQPKPWKLADDRCCANRCFHAQLSSLPLRILTFPFTVISVCIITLDRKSGVWMA